MFDHQRLLTTLSFKQSTAMRDFQRECERIDRSRADDRRKGLLKRQRAKESYARHLRPPTSYAWLGDVGGTDTGRFIPFI